MAAELDLEDVAAQSAKAQRELEELRDLLSATADALDYLTGMTQQQAAALRKDAERYRYLRDNDKQHFWPPVHGSLWVVQYHQPPGQRVMPETRGVGYREDLDATIDAAMALGRRSVAVGAA